VRRRRTHKRGANLPFAPGWMTHRERNREQELARAFQFYSSRFLSTVSEGRGVKPPRIPQSLKASKHGENSEFIKPVLPLPLPHRQRGALFRRQDGSGANLP
jgi:hypothetical protein